MASKHGVAAAAEITDFELANVEAVKNYIQGQKVDCDFMMTQAVDVQLSEDHNRALKSGYDQMVNAGVEATKKAFYVDGKYAEMVRAIRVDGSCFKARSYLDIYILTY